MKAVHHRVTETERNSLIYVLADLCFTGSRFLCDSVTLW